MIVVPISHVPNSGESNFVVGFATTLKVWPSYPGLVEKPSCSNAIVDKIIAEFHSGFFLNLNYGYELVASAVESCTRNLVPLKIHRVERFIHVKSFEALSPQVSGL
ncbi:hypothetical protein TNCV_2208391 [Trichonephila clavipes]|nr:hypothetical protein TNCV_2208391 [Trichonephila clavipes]